MRRPTPRLLLIHAASSLHQPPRLRPRWHSRLLGIGRKPRRNGSPKIWMLPLAMIATSVACLHRWLRSLISEPRTWGWAGFKSSARDRGDAPRAITTLGAPSNAATGDDQWPSPSHAGLPPSATYADHYWVVAAGRDVPTPPGASWLCGRQFRGLIWPGGL